jgi:hypothetical protein
LVIVNCAFEIKGKMNKDKRMIFFIAEVFFSCFNQIQRIIEGNIISARQ